MDGDQYPCKDLRTKKAKGLGLESEAYLKKPLRSVVALKCVKTGMKKMFSPMSPNICTKCMFGKEIGKRFTRAPDV